jgi:LemA protein
MALADNPVVITFVVLVALAVGGYTVVIYNGLIRLRKNIDESMGNIDVLLKQRSEEIPNLVDTAQEYMSYERETLQKITSQRTEVQKASTPKQKAEADQQMRSMLGSLFAVAEDYPELKSNQQFQKVQQRISDIQDKISSRREFYNDSVTTYNTRINQIPYNIVASLLGYTEKEVFEATEQEKQNVDISNEFNN